MKQQRIFDGQHYEHLNRARGDVVTKLLQDLKDPLQLKTAVDVGCGLGHFSALLQSLGFQVVASDGREENVKEAARRVPTVQFHTINAEDYELRTLGVFDIGFCFGLLYHLENPFLAIRHLHAITKSVLLVEGLIYPGKDPIMGLVEETEFEDQGLRNYAFYPTEACLLKMMYRVGFPYAYLLRQPPDHPGYVDQSYLQKNRTILVASKIPLHTKLLILAPEPPSAIKPWVELTSESSGSLKKLKNFAKRPLAQKMESLKKIVKGK